MIRDACFKCHGDLVKNDDGYVCTKCSKEYTVELTPILRDGLREKVQEKK